ncbi:MAG TPA: hypothetical protein VFE72_02870 [Lysobacter sp.]|nr:hypothetical protein [Lysobacter sp.]
MPTYRIVIELDTGSAEPIKPRAEELTRDYEETRQEVGNALPRPVDPREVERVIAITVLSELAGRMAAERLEHLTDVLATDELPPVQPHDPAPVVLERHPTTDGPGALLRVTCMAVERPPVTLVSPPTTTETATP